MQSAIKMTTTLAILALLVTLLGTGEARAGGASIQGVANVNNASVAQLKLLPGIGQAKARAIVTHRKSTPFHKTDDLIKVKGIGDRLLHKIRAYVSVKGKTTIRALAKKKENKRSSGRK